MKLNPLIMMLWLVMSVNLLARVGWTERSEVQQFQGHNEAVDQSKLKGDIVLKAVFTPAGSASAATSDIVKLTSIIGDLTVSEIRAVQVIENVPLVKDKATVARVFVKWSSPLSQLSDGAYLENVKVKLEGIPGESLTSLPAVAHQYQQATYFSKNSVNLEFTDQIRDILKYQGGEAITASKFFPDSVGTVTYRVVVDPETALFESDESNNERVVEGVVISPFIYPQYQLFWQYTRRADDAAFVTQNLQNVVDPLYNYLLLVYPIPKKVVINSYGNEVRTFDSGKSLLMMLYNLSAYIKENGYNRGVYIVPEESLGDKGTEGISSWIAKNVVIVIESAEETVATHEIGHTFGFCDEYEYGGWFGWLPTNPECGADWDEDAYPYGYVAANGWNAEQDDGTPLNGARISVNASEPTTLRRNHFSFMSPYGDWITRTNYLTLMDALVEGGGGLRTHEGLLRTAGGKERVPVVGVIGSFYEDETFELYRVIPSMGYESRIAPGKFALEWLDAKGQILHRLPFGQREMYYDYDGVGKRVMPISLDIEEPETAYRLRIVKDGKELFGLNRTPNAPQVQLGKLRRISEQESVVSVEVSDKDGDSCRITLQYRANQDSAWHGLGESSGTGFREFRFNPNAPNLPGSKTGILRARACDGLNCTNAEIPLLGIANKPPKLHLYRQGEVNDPFEEAVRHKKVREHYFYTVNAYDVEDGEIDDKVQWYDSQGVLVGKGKSFITKVKIKGLTAKVSDSNGQEVQLKVEE